MEAQADEVSWDGVELDMARTIMEQGEKFMAAQLQASIAADARATASANLFTAAAAAVFAAGIAYFGAAQPEASAILVGSIVTGMLLIASASMSFYAARPTRFYFPGNQPSQWWPHATSDLVEMLGGESENYDARIDFNGNVLEANGDWQKRAGLVAVIAPIVGLTAWAICHFLLLLA